MSVATHLATEDQSLPPDAYFRWPGFILWRDPPRATMDLVIPPPEGDEDAGNTEYNTWRELPAEWESLGEVAQGELLETLRPDMEADLIQQYTDNPPSADAA